MEILSILKYQEPFDKISQKKDYVIFESMFYMCFNILCKAKGSIGRWIFEKGDSIRSYVILSTHISKDL